MAAQVSETRAPGTQSASTQLTQEPVIKLPGNVTQFIEGLLDCDHGEGYEQGCFHCVEMAIENYSESQGRDIKAAEFLSTISKDVQKSVAGVAAKMWEQLDRK